MFVHKRNTSLVSIKGTAKYGEFIVILCWWEERVAVSQAAIGRELHGTHR